MTIFANDMPGAAQPVNSAYTTKDSKGSYLTNKNLFANDAIPGVALFEQGSDIYARYPLPTNSTYARILYKNKYMEFGGTQYLLPSRHRL